MTSMRGWKNVSRASYCIFYEALPMILTLYWTDSYCSIHSHLFCSSYAIYLLRSGIATDLDSRRLSYHLVSQTICLPSLNSMMVFNLVCTVRKITLERLLSSQTFWVLQLIQMKDFLNSVKISCDTQSK